MQESDTVLRKNAWVITHDMTGTPEYRAWQHMKDRCLNPKSQRYDRYGERGITVCDRWLGENGFENFLADVGARPSNAHSLGRQNNNGNYEPGNVRWETDEEQNANKSTSRFVMLNGEKLTVNQAAKKLGMCGRTLGLRLDAGMSDEDATRTPVESRRWLSRDEVSVIKGLLNRGFARREIADFFGTCLGSIDYIHVGRSFKSVPEALEFDVAKAIQELQSRKEIRDAIEAERRADA